MKSPRQIQHQRAFRHIQRSAALSDPPAPANPRCRCGSPSCWLYMPAGASWPWYCAECVPRGCSCSLEFFEDDGDPNGDSVIPDHAFSRDGFDEHWRLAPCIEYSFVGNREPLSWG